MVDRDYQTYTYIGSVGPDGETTSLDVLKMVVKLKHPVTCVDIDAGDHETTWRVFVIGTTLEFEERLQLHLQRFPDGEIAKKVLLPIEDAILRCIDIYDPDAVW